MQKYVMGASRGFLVLHLAWLLGASACDEGDRFRSVGEGELDGGRNAEPDSGDASATYRDGSFDLPDGATLLSDGGVRLADGMVVDGEQFLGDDEDAGLEEPDVSTCTVSEQDLFETQVDFGTEGGFALREAPVTGFGIAYQGSASGTCAGSLTVGLIPATGAFPDPAPLIDECKVLTDVALTGTADHWHVAWVDNSAGSAELYTLALDPSMRGEPDNRVRHTDNEGLQERRPVLTTHKGNAVLAWATHDAAGDRYRVDTQVLSDGQSPHGVFDFDAKHKPQSLALGSVGNALDLAWVGPLSNPGVWLQVLDDEGRTAGELHKLTERVGASSSVDLAYRTTGGAVVYSIVVDGVPQVRFRRLGFDGAPREGERRIVGQFAQDASIHSIAAGYVVAYRSLPGGESDQPEIRLTFVTKEGNVSKDDNGVLRSFPIAASTLAQGRTTVTVSVDGQLMVSWLDADPSSGKNLLKVMRRRLSCQ